MNKSELFVIKFGAEWCGPCRMMDQSFSSPEVLKALEQYANKPYFEAKNEKVRVFKIDTDKEKVYTQEFSISSLPTTIIVDKEGNVYKRLIGYMSPSALAEWLNQEITKPLHKVNDTSFL